MKQLCPGDVLYPKTGTNLSLECSSTVGPRLKNEKMINSEICSTSFLKWISHLMIKYTCFLFTFGKLFVGIKSNYSWILAILVLVFAFARPRHSATTAIWERYYSINRTESNSHNSSSSYYPHSTGHMMETSLFVSVSWWRQGQLSIVKPYYSPQCPNPSKSSNST